MMGRGQNNLHIIDCIFDQETNPRSWANMANNPDDRTRLIF